MSPQVFTDVGSKCSPGWAAGGSSTSNEVSPWNEVQPRFSPPATTECSEDAATSEAARGGSRYPETAAWYSVNWLACSMKAWPTIGPSTEPVRIHIADSTKLYGLVP